jgi:Ca2+-dependent lipid-binding protein
LALFFKKEKLCSLLSIKCSPHSTLSTRETSMESAEGQAGSTAEIVQKLKSTPTDFQIRVHLHEGREIEGKDSNGLSDPFCVVTILSKKKTTHLIPKTTSPRWNQSLYFQVRSPADQFFSEKVVLSFSFFL